MMKELGIEENKWRKGEKRDVGVSTEAYDVNDVKGIHGCNHESFKMSICLLLLLLSHHQVSFVFLYSGCYCSCSLCLFPFIDLCVRYCDFSAVCLCCCCHRPCCSCNRRSVITRREQAMHARNLYLL